MSPDRIVTVPYIPDTKEGLIQLGPSNKSAVTRLAIYAQEIIDSKKELPESPFAEWVADRICGEDRQDLVLFLQGRRGSGKSYTALYIGKRFGEAISRRMGGTWQNYFSMDTCATLEDTENILELTKSAKKYQVVLIDDCSIAISNRSWNSQQNRNFNALLAVCRTKRWVLILTAPLKKHVDNQTREMCDINMTIWKSFHTGGFNIVKANSAEMNNFSGKEYSRRLNFFKKKVKFWVAFKPDKDLVTAYDKKRDEAVTRLNAKIVETGRYDSISKKEPAVKQSKADANADKAALEKGDSIRDILVKNPYATLMDLSSETGLSQQPLKRVLYKLGIKLNKKAKAA